MTLMVSAGSAGLVSPGHLAGNHYRLRRDVPVESAPAFRRDDHEHAADRIMGVFPAWLVLWGTYSREFGEFPCFGVPGEGYAHSPDASRRAGMMHRLQRSAEEENRSEKPRDYGSGSR